MVLKSPDIPSMLVETAYFPIRRRGTRCADPPLRAKLAAALHSGVPELFLCQSAGRKHR